VSDPLDIHVHGSSRCLDRHRRVSTQHPFGSVRHEPTIGSREGERIGPSVHPSCRRMPGRQGDWACAGRPEGGCRVRVYDSRSPGLSAHA
jgi:hypothetical protein